MHDYQGQHIHFVTGKLAAEALREVVESLAADLGFAFSIDVLPITVAALMTPNWIARHINVPSEATQVVLPGYCHGSTTELTERFELPIHFGPKDLRQLPKQFGKSIVGFDDYGKYTTEIIAEINHAPRFTLEEIIQHARLLADAGADVIDVGCEPGDAWNGVADCVAALKNEGHRVSIDSLNPVEISAAAQAGAELVLSVNSSNVESAGDWGIEVVAIPDVPDSNSELETTLESLERQGVSYRIDPILEPLGCGFAASIGRYLDVRKSFPAAEMMMGIGNITELTDADSAAINVLLLGICQELRIASVLTTQVIPWAQTSVRECDLARRLVHFAVDKGIPPKHVEPNLVILRDPQVSEYGEQRLQQLADQITDNNYRIFAERESVHLLSRQIHLSDTDPFSLFEKLLETQPKNMDPAHAFYLGYEMAKATTALTLGKNYEQDESLNWGFLTRDEVRHRLKRQKPAAAPEVDKGADS
jgi:dihydropteroate synthase